MYRKITKIKEYFTDKDGNKVLVKTEGKKSEEVIVMDMPLTIRILEYTRERLTTDVEVHKLAKALACLAESNTVLRMSEYEKILEESMKP